MSLSNYKKDDIIPDQINDFRVWKQQQNMVNENIIGKAMKSQSQVKNWAEVLNEDYKNYKNLDYDYYLKTNEGNAKNKYRNVLSQNVNKIVTDVSKLVSEMKKSDENLSKLNINSLLNTKNQIKKVEKLGDGTSIEKMKEKEYKSALEGKARKSPNYKYLSDCYRRQLNRVLLNFNPIKHLGNINSMRKQNPELNKQYEEQTKNIEKEIFNITSPNFYRNQYKKFHKMFHDKKCNKEDNDENIDDNNKKAIEEKNSKNIKDKNYSLPKLANRTTMGFYKGKKYFPTETDFNTPIKFNSKLNLYYKFGKKNKKKKKLEMKFPDKEGRKMELELMEDACKRMINSIKYIEDDENNFYYKYSRLNSDERKKEHSFILKDNLNTERILLKIQKNNILRGIGDLMETKTKKVTEDIKDYGKQINDIKDEIIQDIEEQELKEKNNKYII